MWDLSMLWIYSLLQIYSNTRLKMRSSNSLQGKSFLKESHLSPRSQEAAVPEELDSNRAQNVGSKLCLWSHNSVSLGGTSSQNFAWSISASYHRKHNGFNRWRKNNLKDLWMCPHGLLCLEMLPSNTLLLHTACILNWKQCSLTMWHYIINMGGPNWHCHSTVLISPPEILMWMQLHCSAVFLGVLLLSEFTRLCGVSVPAPSGDICYKCTFHISYIIILK